MLMQNFFKISGTRTLLFSYEEKEVIHTTEKRGTKVVKHKHLQIIESNKMTLKGIYVFFTRPFTKYEINMGNMIRVGNCYILF